MQTSENRGLNIFNSIPFRYSIEQVARLVEQQSNDKKTDNILSIEKEKQFVKINKTLKLMQSIRMCLLHYHKNNNKLRENLIVIINKKLTELKDKKMLLIEGEEYETDYWWVYDWHRKGYSDYRKIKEDVLLKKSSISTRGNLLIAIGDDEKMYFHGEGKTITYGDIFYATNPLKINNYFKQTYDSIRYEKTQRLLDVNGDRYLVNYYAIKPSILKKSEVDGKYWTNVITKNLIDQQQLVDSFTSIVDYCNKKYNCVR